jgi:conjugal transfer mating pair stabilization protein TraN
MASVNQCQIISQEVSGVYQSTIVVTDTSGTVISTTAMSSLSPAVQAGVQTGVQTGSVVEGTTAYCMQLISEYTPVIAVASMIIMQILYGVGCDIDDVQTAEQIASHECHYVGEYCEFDVPLLGCFQKSKTYCCFNSMMARIIQEQGRPQLTTYGPTGSWGTPEIPNCKGFTPDEFESLDFSKIDFSEYIAQIQLNLANNIQNAQNKIQGKIQSRIQQIQNHP